VLTSVRKSSPPSVSLWKGQPRLGACYACRVAGCCFPNSLRHLSRPSAKGCYQYHSIILRPEYCRPYWSYQQRCDLWRCRLSLGVSKLITAPMANEVWLQSTKRGYRCFWLRRGPERCSQFPPAKGAKTNMGHNLGGLTCAAASPTIPDWSPIDSSSLKPC